jgi:hypothetical protein
MVASGSSNLFFNRDTKVYIKQGSNIWEMPVLNGYSFSQSTNSSTVTVNEMADSLGRSRRGQRVFNDSVSPAEWSFDSYVRPASLSSQMRSTDEILWASMVNNQTFIPAVLTGGLTINGTPALNSSTVTAASFTTNITSPTITSPGVLSVTFLSQPSAIMAVGDSVVFGALVFGSTTVTSGTVATYTPTGATFNIDPAASGAVTAATHTVRVPGKVVLTVTNTYSVGDILNVGGLTAAIGGSITSGTVVSQSGTNLVLRLPVTTQSGTITLGSPAVVSNGILTITTAKQTQTVAKVGDTITLSGITATNYGGNITTGTVRTVTAGGADDTYTIYTGTGFSGPLTVNSPRIKNAAYSSTETELDFNFSASNTTTLGTFDLYFVLGGSQVSDANYVNNGDTTVYEIKECSVNEVTINFDIDGIATLSWSGMGKTITELDVFNASGAITTAFKTGGTVSGAVITNNLVRNRLTVLSATSTSPTATTYNLALTGGSITISNNMNYLTPETLGVVNQPLGHITGTRSVTGSFTTYLDEAVNGSIDLYKNLVSATSTITNDFNLQFFVGGKNSNNTHPVGPGVLFDLGHCHLEIPSINNDDVISLEVNFTALPSNIAGTDEINKIRYVGIAPA